MDLQLIKFAIGVIASVLCTIILLFYFYAKLLVSKKIEPHVDSKVGKPNE